MVKMKSGGPDMVVVDETRNGLNLICASGGTVPAIVINKMTFPHESLCLSVTSRGLKLSLVGEVSGNKFSTGTVGVV